MPDIHIEKRHNLDFATARQQAQQWLSKAEQAYGMKINYQQGEDTDTASISRSGVDGRAFLDADKLIVEADLAFLAKPLKGRIQQEIHNGLDKYFA